VDIAVTKPKDGLIAFASVVLDDQLYLSSIAIHSKLAGTGYRLTYPTRKVGEAQFSIFHPIRKPVGLAIERAVLEKLKDVMIITDTGKKKWSDRTRSYQIVWEAVPGKFQSDWDAWLKFQEKLQSLK
jgi:stage V sporulation protein G